MAGIDDIWKDAIAALRPVLEAIYADAKEEGRREAAAEFKAKLAMMLDESPASSVKARPPVTLDKRTDSVVPAVRKETKGRAIPGTVKPKIFKVISGAANGVATREIADRTGFKYNSIRGTLWQLKKEGAITNRDDRWFAVRSTMSVVEIGDLQAEVAPEDEIAPGF